ncbi:MAG: hypothetical protein GY757_06885 [bacterium]|nr:hypothetical protein [bacterium]
MKNEKNFEGILHCYRENLELEEQIETIKEKIDSHPCRLYVLFDFMDGIIVAAADKGRFFKKGVIYRNKYNLLWGKFLGPGFLHDLFLPGLPFTCLYFRRFR